MSKLWNPGARPESVGVFLRDWCLLGGNRTTRLEHLFYAYESYCRRMGIKDLTLGEFTAEMEQRGFTQVERFGEPVWQGIALTFQQESRATPRHGDRYPVL